MKYLLDTNICIYLIKKKPEKLIRKIKKFKIEELCISAITISELEYGIQKSKYPERNKIALIEFLIPFQILEYDLSAAEEYGRIRKELEQRGKIIGPMDLLIAAHAKSKGLIIVTNNEKEFGRVDGLSVENWTR